jgi:hypothetical protein
MISAPFTFLLLILLVLVFVVLVVLIEMGVLTYAYAKIGVRPRYAFTVMMLSLVGRRVNHRFRIMPREVLRMLDSGGLQQCARPARSRATIPGARAAATRTSQHSKPPARADG